MTKELEKIIRATNNDEDESYDSMHLMLEEHLRPIPPKTNNRLSKEIFEEHKHLAKEYLKVRNWFTRFCYIDGNDLLVFVDPNRTSVCNKT